ncbi:MAG: translocase FtsK, partial [Solirubrobacteraceae bacterium]|nr:translocase FtsK [Solirubrobacteraceae bacterium]
MPATKKPARKPAKKPVRKPARRARRSSSWRAGLPVLEQHHVDMLGLALVCLGVFLAFPLYLGFDGGHAGAWIVKACRYFVGEIAYAAPVFFVAAGVLTVLRPVLPSVRPYRSGAACLIMASTLAIANGTLGIGPGVATVQWKPMLFEFRGGILGDALHYASASAFGSLGAHLIAVFLFLAGLLLITGASIAGVLKATSSGVADTTRALRRGSEELAAIGGRTRRPAFELPEPDGFEPVVTRQVTLPPIDIFTPDAPGQGSDPLEGLEPEIPAPVESADEEGSDPLEGLEAEEGDVDEPRHEIEPHIEWAVPEPKRVLRFSTAEGLRPDTRGQEKITARLVEALSHFGVQAQ